ncbi:MAG: dihydropteroate synthase [Solirubrobacterales bacterium]|nr:dihydropteroate synthase [Solirubrobacterales bacterium]OJU93663.1 MAG: dihydropteroate synthase [Solirubrobacterales bacterium 67-14]
MKVMGIVNVTPDSFSDGGEFFDHEKAIEHGMELVRQGADVLDIGGESTRPGADDVPLEEELRRVMPVVEGLAGAAPVSIDTTKAEVARQAIAAGARIVNDVTALRGDPEMAGACAEAGVEVVLMHMLGTPRTMQEDPRYDDVVGEVSEFLAVQAGLAEAAGIAREKLWIDPGIGFGKTVDHNLALLKSTRTLSEMGLPVLVGPSRKSFIGKLSGDAPEPRRLGGTIAACLAAMEGGAAMVRVHDVGPVAQAVRVASAIEAGSADPARPRR